MVQKLTPKLIKQRMTGERVSLVGGAGFIGHNLALALRNVGAEVQIIDNLMQNNMLQMSVMMTSILSDASLIIAF